jgi:hypothetical protein
MNAVIVAFLLPLLLGWTLRFLAFVIVWLLGLGVYAIWLLPGDLTLLQRVLMIIAVGIAAQAGYFVNIFVRSMFGKDGDGRAG